MDENKKGIGYKNILKLLIEYAAIALLVVIFFRLVLIITFVPSESMEDTIATGDMLIGTEEDVYYIKRVIGLPGETITVENGKVYADGKELDASFIKEDMDNSGNGIFEVPDNCYFMMGDNRNNSYDSRFWDDPYVPIDNFIAHARFIIYPFNQIGEI